MNSPTELALRTPPHNIEAEQALLGAILVNNEAFYGVSDFLEPKHFFEPIHQRIFELAGDLIRVGKLGDAGDVKDLAASGPRHRRAQRQSIPGAACRRGDDHHQRRGLRPYRL